MRLALPASFLALAALAACGSEPSPKSEGNSLPAAEKSAPGNVAAAPAAPAVAPLTAEGWGPLRIGMTLAQVVAAAGPDSDPEAVGGPEPEVCDIFHPARTPEGLMVMIEEGRLTSISASAPTEVRTERGLGPGATAGEVEAAYPGGLKSEPHEYEEAPARYLTVWTVGGGEEPYVRSAAARGIRYEVDHSGRVSVVHAGGPSIQYVEGCL